VVDVAITAGQLLAAFLALRVVFVILPRWRVARSSCPGCGLPLGREAARASVPFYERALGPGTLVMDGPRRYMGARVVRCGGCGAEFVFGELGGLVEPFQGFGS
jgi:hypothetical protein